MAEDALKSLKTYMIQLEQVEAALTSDPDNEELKKLLGDLQEVIALTKNLPETLIESTGTSKSHAEDDTRNEIPIKSWQVGDHCSAIWPEDGKWYNGIIDAITDDGMVAISFEQYDNTTVTNLGMLREVRHTQSSSTGAGHSAESERTRKRQTEAQRQVAKKKKQKKFDRQKMIEEAHEADKAKWQAFTHKFSKSKKLKGVTKKSIFATPEAANGRVGIGTCGIGGKPMTEYTHAEKWRKGT